MSDVRCARPAGALFQADGSWYRPGQDCSRRYGWAISLNRVDVWTESEWKETTVSRIEPGWRDDVVGIHTINRDGVLTVVDWEVSLPT